MSQNQHRWKAWIDNERVRHVLEEAAEGLEWSWSQDQKDPTSYPMNTWYMFIQIEEQLRNQPPVTAGIKLPPPAPPPERFCELVNESTIRAIYEEQNEGSYKAALKQAATHYEGFSEWRKILRAVEAAYLVAHYGIQATPKPRVHFLHRSLLEIADSAHLWDLTLEGIVEFFDDLCPCGRKHKQDAIRKLRGRGSRRLSRPGP